MVQPASLNTTAVPVFVFLFVNETLTVSADQAAFYSSLEILILFTSTSQKHVITHEQVAFIRLKQEIYIRFVQLKQHHVTSGESLISRSSRNDDFDRWFFGNQRPSSRSCIVLFQGSLVNLTLNPHMRKPDQKRERERERETDLG